MTVARTRSEGVNVRNISICSSLCFTSAAGCWFKKREKPAEDSTMQGVPARDRAPVRSRKPPRCGRLLRGAEISEARCVAFSPSRVQSMQRCGCCVQYTSSFINKRDRVHATPRLVQRRRYSNDLTVSSLLQRHHCVVVVMMMMMI